MKKMGFTLMFAMCLLGFIQPSMAQERKSKFGITVSPCWFDMDEDNFCSDALMKKFAQIIHNRPANFVQNQLLYIYKGKYHYRMVVMDKQRKTVQPFRWGFAPAEQAVNDKGEKLVFQFDTQSPQFCVWGNIEAYRDSYSYYNNQPFCFAYTGKGDEAGFEGFTAWW